MPVNWQIKNILVQNSNWSTHVGDAQFQNVIVPTRIRFRLKFNYDSVDSKRNKSRRITTQLMISFDCLGSRTTMNIITSTLDANFVYGSSKETADKLRRFQGGLLKTNSANHHLGLKDLLPPKLESPDAGCVRPNKDVYCFLAGNRL